MMGRTDDPREKNLFFKIQSSGSPYINLMTAAFPNTPWLFVYREPVQVMMSHFKHGSWAANCLRRKHRPSEAIQDIAMKITGRETHDLDDKEYCAAHLASLCDSIVDEFKRSNNGMVV